MVIRIAWYSYEHIIMFWTHLVTSQKVILLDSFTMTETRFLLNLRYISWYFFLDDSDDITWSMVILKVGS